MSADCGSGEILSHNTDVHFFVNGCDCLHNTNGVSYATREHEVTDNDTLCHHTVVVKLVDGLLATHFAYCLTCHLKVVGHAGVFLSKTIVAVLEVGEIYIHQSFKLFQVCHRLITTAIPHHGYGQLGAHNLKHVGKQIDVLRRGDDVDILRPN